MMLIESINTVSFSNDYGKSFGELIDKFYLWFYLEHFCKDDLISTWLQA